MSTELSGLSSFALPVVTLASHAVSITDHASRWTRRRGRVGFFAARATLAPRAVCAALAGFVALAVVTTSAGLVSQSVPAAAADGVTVSGQVSSVEGADAIDVDGITVRLLTPGGDPVIGRDGTPTTATTTADGSFTFPAVGPGQFTLDVEPMPGRTSRPDSVPVDTTAGAVSDVRFEVGMLTSPEPLAPDEGGGHAGLWLAGAIALVTLVALVLTGLSFRRRGTT